jgi:hypothetical protein
MVVGNSGVDIVGCNYRAGFRQPVCCAAQYEEHIAAHRYSLGLSQFGHRSILIESVWGSSVPVHHDRSPGTTA